MSRRSTIVLAAVVVLGSASLLRACSVPVFRFALEQWAADNFQVFIFHRAPLTADQQALIERIDPRDPDAEHVANAWVEVVNLETSDDAESLALWEAQKDATLPWMAVRAPAKFGPPKQFLGSELSATNVSSLLESPTRQTLTERLLKGESAVWMLLESGDPDADRAAAEVLAGELKRLQQELELPPISQKDIDDGFLSVSPDELKIRFSMLRVSRDDAREHAFVQMLLNTEPDLRDPEFAGQPMAIPIFGRGRALYALIGRGINSETIEDTCRFLTGACQCTVKAQNPGVDMLTTARWDSLVTPTLRPDTALPTLTGLAAFGDAIDSVQPGPQPGSEAPSRVSDPATFVDDAAEPDHSTHTKPANEAETQAGLSAAPHGADPVRSTSVGLNAIYVCGGLALLVGVLSLTFTRRM